METSSDSDARAARAVAPVAGVVLAAGSGTRMGRPKADIGLGGVRLLNLALETLERSGCWPLLAVVRPGTECSAPAVVNPDPERGMRSSLDLAVENLPENTAAAAVILVDVPGLTADAVRAVVKGWRPGRVALARTGGHRTHPTVMSIDMWREAIAMAAPDEGARRYLANHPELVDEIRVEFDPRDLDTPAELAAWLADGQPPANGGSTSTTESGPNDSPSRT